MENHTILPSTPSKKSRLYYGYAIVAVCFGIQVVAWGMFSSYGVFFNPLLTEFGWSRATISGALSLCVLLSGFMSIIAGSLTDRFGPKIVLSTCGFLFGSGYLLMSQVNTIWHLFLFYGVLVGTGLSAMNVVLLSTIARWFTKKRGMMSGIVKVGAGVGILSIPLVTSILISTYGWRIALAILGTVTLVFIVSAAQFMRRGPGPTEQFSEANIEAAIVPDSSEKGLSLGEAMRTRQFWTICAAYLTIEFCLNTITIHIAPHAVDAGIPLTTAAGIISIIGAASMVGRLVMGNVADRAGNKQATIICFLVLIAALSWLQLARELWMLCLFATVHGFAHGGFYALISPTIAEFFEIRSHGLILGIVYFSGTIGGSTGPLLTGYIFDVLNSYQLAFLILIVLAIIGLILTTTLKPTDSKRR